MAALAERLRFWLYKWFKPFMVSGLHSAEGVYRKTARVSNTTAILHARKLKLGEGVFIGHHNLIDASGGLDIGEGTQITNFVSILTHSSHQSIRLHGANYTAVAEPVAYNKQPVSIGAYTFIGPHTVVMPGSQLGKGCVVAAYSMVKGSFPDFAIISGNPATQVGDTRDGDRELLKKHPELTDAYEKWAGKQW